MPGITRKHLSRIHTLFSGTKTGGGEGKQKKDDDNGRDKKAT